MHLPATQTLCFLPSYLIKPGDTTVSLAQVYTDASISTLQKYLDQITGIHQVLTSALHLQEDVKTHNFKYTAHKLALLYHAVNSSRTQQDVLRKRIEEHFEDVKALTERARTDSN